MQNVERNASRQSTAYPTVQGHEWGIFDDSFATDNAGRFTRVLAADCFWMPQVHAELVQSMLHFLSADGRVFLVSGFHTGRAKLAVFFDVAAEHGLEVEEIHEEDAEGVRRPWAKERDGGRENPTERKRWLVLAVLKRAMTPPDE